MKMSNFSSTHAFGKSVTDDSRDSSNGSFYGDDRVSESNEDWETTETERTFEEHSQSLSQTTVNDEYEEGADATSSKKRTGTIIDYCVKENKHQRLSHGNGIIDADGSLHLNGRMYKRGETFLSSNKKYDGMAFTIGSYRADGVLGGKFIAECTAIWMRVEKTFIAAKQIKQKWVLLKKHDKKLPPPDNDGKITIPATELSRQLRKGDDNAPNFEKSLCYEEVDKHTCSYYYERGAKVLWKPKKVSSPIAMDLFAGAGGASLGMQQAGWNVKYKLEWNKEAYMTLRCNFGKDATIFQDDIEVFLKDLKLCKDKKINVHPAISEMLYIHGSPPCQGVSSANTSGGACDNQNNKCTLTFLDAIIHFQPKLVSMENVTGIHGKKGLHLLIEVMAGLIDNDYQVQLCYLDSSNYGDAQARKRVILLASKKGWALPSIPEATHGEGERMLPKRTAKDALGSLEQIEPTEDGCIRLNGKEVWDHYKEGTQFGISHDTAYQLDADRPANTVRKTNPVKHYRTDLNRYITARERALLQSFPNTFRFFGEQRDVFNQVGNAVPVKMAEAIGKSIMDSYELGRNSDPS